MSGSQNLRVGLNFTLEELLKALAGEVCIQAGDLFFEGVSTDSRQIRKGDLFFAIKGEKFDGHDFAVDAIKQGALACVFEKDIKNCPGIKVADSAKALGSLAKFYRKRFQGRVIGITGSNGKTTTKNMVASILAGMGKTVKSQASFNNHVGVPLTVLGSASDVEYLVVELGMNHPGEIKYLAGICMPDVGLITNIGPVHLEFLSDIEGVTREKRELFESLGDEGWAVINADDENVVKAAKGIKAKKISYSTKGFDADVLVDCKLKDLSGLDLVVQNSGKSFHAGVPLTGSHNSSNAAAAVTVAILLGAGETDIKEGLALVENEERRFEIIRLSGGSILVNDCYNANPVSVGAALREVSRMEGKKLLVFGDMLELGEESEFHHKQVGKIAAQMGFEEIFLLGENSKFVERGVLEENFPKEKVHLGETHSEIANLIKKKLTKNSIILVKGSRGMAMEKVSGELMK